MADAVNKHPSLAIVSEVLPNRWEPHLLSFCIKLARSGRYKLPL